MNYFPHLIACKASPTIFQKFFKLAIFNIIVEKIFLERLPNVLAYLYSTCECKLYLIYTRPLLVVLHLPYEKKFYHIFWKMGIWLFRKIFVDELFVRKIQKVVKIFLVVHMFFGFNKSSMTKLILVVTFSND